MPPFCSFLHRLLWILVVVNHKEFSTTAGPDCMQKCGNLTVPYPFGIGLRAGCSMRGWFDINCVTSFNPPKAFIANTNLEVIEINPSEVRIKNQVAFRCFDRSGHMVSQNAGLISLAGTPYTFSEANIFTALGCDDMVGVEYNVFGTGCMTYCSKIEDLLDQSCTGMGCCQIALAKGLKNLLTYHGSFSNHTTVWSFNPCTYFFLGEQNRFVFNGSDLNDPTLLEKITENVPIVLEWSIGNQSCRDTQQLADNTCKQNSECVDSNSSVGGYRCHCMKGYQGNPYVSPGCIDIDECDDRPCDPNGICHNFPGGYSCSCPHGYTGDGRKSGLGCINQSSTFPMMKFSLGFSFGVFSLIATMMCLFYCVRKRKLLNQRQKFFQKNGGELLKQRISPNGEASESARIFTIEELKKATMNYSADNILGKGGFGVVYKGVLDDQRVVAIKKSKIMDESQVESFVNEVLILTQVNHRNVVRLLGCCFETEVPQLVYEYVSNGTLLDHIHNSKDKPWFSFENRIRIAAEAANAFNYLHSAASPPIIHRDVKSANILLDERYTAKVSDFGASRLVPLDQTRVTTAVMGTMGYLDPEYFNSGKLTEKSDVYSFGVVLAELITGRKPFLNVKSEEERALANYFIVSKKEGRLFQILEPRIRWEGSFEQIQAAAELVIRCLKLEGEDRPTMNEVAEELERVRKLPHGHPNEQHAYEGLEESVSLFTEQSDLFSVSTNLQHSDLYPLSTTRSDNQWR